MLHPAQETYWFISGQFILCLLLLSSLVPFLLAISKRFRLMRLGQPENRFDKITTRIKSVFIFVLGHRRLFDSPWSGIIHFMIFWGFIVFSFGYIFMIGEGFVKGFTIEGILGQSFSEYYRGFQNLFGLLVIIGIFMAFLQRYILRPKRLENKPGAIIILWLILFIMLTHFMMDGIQPILLENEGVVSSPLASAPISNIIANFFSDSGLSVSSLRTLYQITWWFHLGMILSFLVYIPHSKHFHLILCPFNEFFRSLTPKGELKLLDLEKGENLGVSKVTEYTWKDILDLYCCTECGRCQEACPAKISDKPLNPKKIICNLRDHLIANSSIILKQASGRNKKDKTDIETGANDSLNLIGTTITEDEIWACTTCGNCEEQCPVFIEQPDKIIELRRYLVLAESRFPAELKTMFKNMETNGNPWPVNWDQRANWAKGLDVKIMAEQKQPVDPVRKFNNKETNDSPDSCGNSMKLSNGVDVLLWVGCAGSIDDRNIKISQTLVNIFKKSGISFAILGNEEKCCGDPVRRTGNEYLFQTLAQKNVETLKKYKFGKIVTACPHCFNTLKNEYPQFDGHFEVVHHSEYLLELIDQCMIKLPREFNKIITYQDSCYLGRYNDIYQAPRKVLKAIPGLRLKEMPRRKSNSFCCGAGGGRMWMEEKIGTRINQIRTEEAIKIKPDIISTACPYCLTMLSDGVKEKDLSDAIKVMDLVEVINEALPQKSITN